MRSYSAMTGKCFVCIHTMLVMVFFVPSIPCGNFTEQPILLEFDESISDPSNLLSSWTGRIADNCTMIGVSCNSNHSGRELCVSGTYSFSFYCSKSFKLPLHAVGVKINCSGIDENFWGTPSPVISEFGVLFLLCKNLTSESPVGILFLRNLIELDHEGKLLSENISLCDSSYLRKSSVNCIQLTTLLLSSNTSNGRIPCEFGGLRMPEVLDVSGNDLKAPAPSEFGQLTSLLSSNLSSHVPRTGTIHDLREQFRRPVPRALLLVAQRDINGSQDSEPSTGFNVQAEFALITVGVGLLFIFLVQLLVSICRKIEGSRSSVDIPEITIINDIGVPLTLEIVNRATGDFSSTNCIGRGGVGRVYRAEVSSGIVVAIKRFSPSRPEGIPQFHAEIKILGLINHRHIVKLIGYHLSADAMFLIYNYISGGNLEQYIEEREEKGFCWIKLHKISLNIATAVSYLHDHFTPQALHRDIKPSNILLDDDLNAYLSDFGLSMAMPSADADPQAEVVGTYPYVAPEYVMESQVSDKIDVYSYGVTLLELMSTKRALDPSFQSYDHGFNVVSWARMQTDSGNEMDIFLPVLLDNGPQRKLLEILRLALMCTVDSPTARLKMAQVVEMLTALEAGTSSE